MSAVAPPAPPAGAARADAGTAAERLAPWAEPPEARVLYIYPETLGPSPEPARNALAHLSRYLAGDMLAIWVVDPKDDPAELFARMQGATGRFTFHPMRWRRRPAGLKQLADARFWIRTARRLARAHGRYDVVVTYGPYRTAITGVLLKYLLGAKLVVEYPGHPTRSFELARKRFSGVKRLLAKGALRFVARHADHLRLMYPEQLQGLVPLTAEDRRRTSVFHDFVPVSLVPRGQSPEPYLMFLGSPFWMKGVDLLLQAFAAIADEFPALRLKLVGWDPDLAGWRARLADQPRIDVTGPLPHPEAMALMARCTAFVLPSRTEAAPRVVLEAMAAGRPVVASRVDGIPHYVRDGETGLLFTGDDVAALTAQLRRVLRDPALAQRLGRRAAEVAHTELSETAYVEHFRAMVGRTLAS